MPPTAPPQHSQRRRRYFVDPQTQGALLQHALTHWLWTTSIFALIVLVFRVAPAWMSGEGRMAIWYHISPYIVASLVLLPIATYRAIRFSHRFAGPMVRVRAIMKQLARGETPARLALRRGDFWTDLAEDLNEVATRMAGVNYDSEPGEPRETTVLVNSSLDQSTRQRDDLRISDLAP